MIDVPSVVFLNVGAGPQTAVGCTQDSRTEYCKMKKFAHDSFKLDDNGREFSERVENIVGKGEISRLDQNSFFHNVSNICTVDT